MTPVRMLYSPSRLAGILGTAVLAAGWILACRPTDASRPIGAGPNVILISVDTLRADRMSLYGHTRDTSPNLERLARDAIVFEQAYQNGGGTLPSHMTMMTSLYPRTHWVTPSTGRVLSEDRTTLAEVFHQGGWDTAAFTDGGWMAEKFGFGQGFDTYADAAGGGFETILPRALAWLGRNRQRPVFLFLHSYDVHSKTDRLPYECPENGHWRYLKPGQIPGVFDGCRDGLCSSQLLATLDSRLTSGELAPTDALTPDEVEWMRTLYDGCVHYADQQLGKFFDRLRELGIYDGAILVVTSDHGEEFLDHGRLLHHQNGFEETARVPLVIKLPAGAHGGQRRSELGSLVDLMPTLLDFVDLPIPEAGQGVSLRPAIETSLAVRSDVHIYSVLRRGPFKYFAESGDIYELEEDAGETRPVEIDAARRDALNQRLWDLVNRDIELQQAFDEGRSTNVELSEQERLHLEALGYLHEPNEE